MSKGLVAPLLVVLALSSTVRIANHLRVARAPEDGGAAAWIATDPDSLYHMRRLARALDDGGRVAPRDPRLSASFENDAGAAAGAPIPWPPYYTQLLWLAAAPFAPDDEPARARFVEHLVATTPLVCSALTSLVVALAAGCLAGRGAALVAGVYHAFSFCALRYGYWGMGDHHAFVTLLHALLLLGLGRALASQRRPWRSGIALGVLGGLALGSWVASAGHLVLVELTFAALLAAGGGARVARLGVAFNLAAALTVLPAVLLGAPGPSLVTLSMVYPLLLAVAACGFWGLERFQSAGPDDPGLTPARALFVFLFMNLGGFLVWLEARDQLGVALDWARGENTFMGSINESQPLALLSAAPLKWLGWGVVLLPLAWLAALRACVRRRALELLPWVVAAPPLAWLALEQRRFAEALAVPLAVLLGWAVARAAGCAIGCLAAPRAAPARAACAVLALALPAAAHPGVVRTTLLRLADGAGFEATDELAHQRGLRRAAEWIAAHADGEAPLVLAEWDLGHLLEWGAGASTVATNFGSYLGEETFLEPWRVLLAEDVEEAQERLSARGVRYVLTTSRDARNLDTALRAVYPGARDAWSAPRLAGTLLGRLGGLNVSAGPLGAGLDALRLVHVSADADQANGQPHARVWQVVPGATLVGRGAPGALLRVRLRVAYPGTASDVFWSGSAVAGADGVARVRVPYATDAPNGDGRARGAYAWTLDGAAGELAVAERDVLAGRALPLR